MCNACLEMELYFAYLDDLEQKKKAEQASAQPWECEVTVIPQQDEAADVPRTAASEKTKSRFVCDEPE